MNRDRVYLVAVSWTHLSMAFLALPWNFVITLRFIGGLPVSELAILSTEDALLDKAWRAVRLLVNSSICKSSGDTSLQLKYTQTYDRFPDPTIIVDKHYLEIEDDGPHQPQDNGRASISNVRGIDIDQFDLENKLND